VLAGHDPVRALSELARKRNARGVVVSVSPEDNLREMEAAVLGAIMDEIRRSAPSLERALDAELSKISSAAARLSYLTARLSGLGRYTLAAAAALRLSAGQALVAPEAFRVSRSPHALEVPAAIGIDYRTVRPFLDPADPVRDLKRFMDYQARMIQEQTGEKVVVELVFRGPDAEELYGASGIKGIPCRIVRSERVEDIALDAQGKGDIAGPEQYALVAVDSPEGIAAPRKDLADQGHLLLVEPASFEKRLNNLGPAILRAYDVVRLGGDVEGILGMVVDRLTGAVLWKASRIDWKSVMNRVQTSVQMAETSA